MVILKLFWDTSFPRQLSAQSHPETLIWLAFPPYPLQFARELQQRNAGRISTRYSPHLLQSMHKYQRRAATVWEIRIEKKPSDYFSPLYPNFTPVDNFTWFLFSCEGEAVGLWLPYWEPFAWLTAWALQFRPITGWLSSYLASGFWCYRKAFAFVTHLIPSDFCNENNAVIMTLSRTPGTFCRWK